MSEPLSTKERRFWDRNGFLLLNGCLSEAEIDSLTESLSELAGASGSWTAEQRKSQTSTAGNGQHLDIIRLPYLTDSVHFLLDHPKVFGKLLSLMGPFIYTPGMEYLERHSHVAPLLRLHTDGGGSLRCIFPSTENLVLQLKVQFFLTDTDRPDSGNFLMVPGSHRRQFPLDPAGIEAGSQSAIQLLAHRGDVLIFPWSLWHGVAPNRSPNTRRSVITRYAQLWMRPVDYDSVPELLFPNLSVRQKRLLGSIPECHSQGDYYRPHPDHQIDAMFSGEFRDHPDQHRFASMTQPLKALFDQ